jgi:hypothetical protein
MNVKFSLLTKLFLVWRLNKHAYDDASQYAGGYDDRAVALHMVHVIFLGSESINKAPSMLRDAKPPPSGT